MRNLIILAGVLLLTGCNNSSFLSCSPPKYEFAFDASPHLDAPLITIFDNQSGRVKVCTWGGRIDEPAKCGPWSPAADPPAPSG
jgi:hypothetical protein